MTFNKYYASSVEKARQKAQDALGQTYIVIETKEARDGEQAWIHVLNEAPNEEKNKNKSATYSRRDLFPQALSKLKETLYDGLEIFNIEQNSDNRSSAKYIGGPDAATFKNEKQHITESVVHSPAGVPDFSLDLEKEAEPESGKQIQDLTERFERLESLISEQMMAANVQYISHPAFQQLLASGVPQSIITSWFNELLSSGIDPYDRESDFISLLAQKVKKTLDIAATKEPAPFMIFTGLPGAGKSELIMKLARHSDFLAKDTLALVTFYADGKNCYSPLEAFAAEHNIEHYTVENEQDIIILEELSKDFDHALIEITGLNLPKDVESVKIDRLCDALGYDTVEVHHVINASLNDYFLSTDILKRTNFGADYLDITHLDMITQKGRLLPVMQNSNCKIRYISSAPRISGNVSKFDSRHFAKELLSNA